MRIIVTLGLDSWWIKHLRAKSSPWCVLFNKLIKRKLWSWVQQFYWKKSTGVCNSFIKRFSNTLDKKQLMIVIPFLYVFYFQNYTNIGKLSFSSILALSNSVMIIKYLQFQSANPLFRRWHFTSLTIKKCQSYVHVLKVA